MKKNSTASSLFLVLIFFFGCNNKKSVLNTSAVSFDTSQYKIDTLFSRVEINDSILNLTVLRDRLNAISKSYNEDETETSPITVVLSDSTNSHILYKHTFGHKYDTAPNLYYKFFKSQKQALTKKGRLYFTLFENWNGSGSKGKFYFLIYKDGNLEFHLITELSELKDIAISNADDEIICLEAKWGTEGHFDNHTYKISTLVFNNNLFTSKSTSFTKRKYSSVGEKSSKEILQEINLKEPQLLKSINLRNYTTN